MDTGVPARLGVCGISLPLIIWLQPQVHGAYIRLLPLHLRTIENGGVASTMSVWIRQAINSTAFIYIPSPLPSTTQRTRDDKYYKARADWLLGSAIDHVARARLFCGIIS